MKLANLTNVKEGDIFTRLLGGTLPMKVIVGEQDEKHIYVGSHDGAVKSTKEEGWCFRKDTSCEVDEYLGVDGSLDKPNISFLIEYNEELHKKFEKI